MSVRELVLSFPGPETSIQSRLRRIIKASEEKLKPKTGRLENNLQKVFEVQLNWQVKERRLYSYESNQQDATLQVNLLFQVSSTCFGQCFRLSSGKLDCIYSIW
jgi:hypothetical protein